MAISTLLHSIIFISAYQHWYFRYNYFQQGLYQQHGCQSLRITIIICLFLLGVATVVTNTGVNEMQTEYFVWVMDETDSVVKSGVFETKQEAITFSRIINKQRNKYNAVRSLCAEHIVGTPDDKYTLIWQEDIIFGANQKLR
jgi:hypothetical protein